MIGFPPLHLVLQGMTALREQSEFFLYVSPFFSKQMPSNKCLFGRMNFIIVFAVKNCHRINTQYQLKI